MIRPTVPEDTPGLVALAEGTTVFKPLEIQALREVLDDYHAHEKEVGHRCVTYEKDGEIVGFAYYAPAAMTDRTWYLYWIAVVKDVQARGTGSRLLRHLEDDIRVVANRSIGAFVIQGRCDAGSARVARQDPRGAGAAGSG